MTEIILHILLIYVAYSILVAIFRLVKDRLVFRGNWRKGYIYAFTDLGFILPVVKIGRTNDLKQRLSAHTTAAPFGLVVYSRFPVKNDVVAEKALHRRYQKVRVRNNGEWFWLTLPMFFELILLNVFYPRH